MILRIKQIVALVMTVLLIVGSTAACGNGEDQEKKTEIPPAPTNEVAETRVFKIGNITDIAGPSSTALRHINMALEDTARYYNDENLIPGLELEVVMQDAGFDPAKYVSSYEWLTGRQDVDMIFSADPNTVEVIKARADEDHLLVFASSAQDLLLEDPGYVFSAGTHPTNLYYTLMQWISENHWDYQTNGPATVGVAGWLTDIEKAMAAGVESYCNDYPERFEWKGRHLKDLGFNWETQAEALKDCDYVVPPAGSLVTFLAAFEKVGGNATFLGSDPHTGFFKMLNTYNSWEKIDGMIFVSESAAWYGDDAMVKMSEELIGKYRPELEQEIRQYGYLYLISGHIYVMLDIIKKTADTVGIENIDSEVIYEMAQSYELTLDGVQRFSFTPAKRFGCDAVTVNEFDSENKAMTRLHEGWIPLIRIE